jgi:hypothetical protein
MSLRGGVLPSKQSPLKWGILRAKIILSVRRLLRRFAARNDMSVRLRHFRDTARLVRVISFDFG